MSSFAKVGAASVAHHPAPVILRRVEATIMAQVDGVLVIANDAAAWDGALQAQAIARAVCCSQEFPGLVPPVGE